VEHVPIEQAEAAAQDQPEDFVAIHEALTKLAALDPRKEQVVELRFFGGLSVAETAEVLGVSPDTLERDWRLARMWLVRELDRGGFIDTGAVAAR
jgi:RNA polymerase sigma factor (sigma-70 family)